MSDNRGAQPLLLGGIICAIALWVLALNWTAPKPNPLLHSLFNVTHVDLGTIGLDRDYSVTYRFENRTLAPVVMQDVRTSCGCVAPRFDRDPIPVAASRDLRLVYSTRTQRDLGPVVKHAVVQFGDGTSVELTLAGKIDRDFEVDPVGLKFSPDQPLQRLVLSRKAADPPDFARLILNGEQSTYDIRLVEATDDRREFEVRLKTVTASSHLSRLSIVDADNPTAPVTFGTVNCDRDGPTIKPGSFVVVRGDDNSPLRQQFELQSYAQEAAAIVELALEDGPLHDLIEVEFDAAVNPQQFALRLKDFPETTLATGTLFVRYRTKLSENIGQLNLPCRTVRPAAK